MLGQFRRAWGKRRRRRNGHNSWRRGRIRSGNWWNEPKRRHHGAGRCECNGRSAGYRRNITRRRAPSHRRYDRYRHWWVRDGRWHNRIGRWGHSSRWHIRSWRAYCDGWRERQRWQLGQRRNGGHGRSYGGSGGWRRKRRHGRCPNNEHRHKHGASNVLRVTFWERHQSWDDRLAIPDGHEGSGCGANRQYQYDR